MLRLNMTRAMKLPAAREFAIPAPFPGKYPTRVGMLVEWERGGETGCWRYVGKPNSIAAKRFEVEVEKGGLRMLAVMEWDRAWKITERLMQWNGPIMAPPVVAIPSLQIVSPWLWTVYHPWHDIRNSATAWMQQGVWIHKISCALGENTRIYSASPEIGSIYISDYRRRVNVVGQQPQKQTKKYAAPNTDWATWNMTVNPTPAPDEPAPEPLWRRAARQAEEMQRGAAQQTAPNLVGWAQQFQQTTQPAQPRPRRRNLFDDVFNNGGVE